ncbi:AraC-like ligand-binding domain-containing protein [Streptomyces specialis]|uniref:AraC-like ligand-binding domain-containing protein n=1 Tax=Streptomyces specialis TaxID=498367 RepID=UPI00099E5CED|nr:helix-turn-helix domain-containing protein [Streptomyces specialis]
MEKVFDSDDLPSAERIDAWCELASGTLTPSAFTIDRGSGFRASLRAADLGAAQVTAMTYSSLESRRTPRLIRRSDPELYAVGLIVRGRQGIRQAGRETVLDASGLVLYSTFRPFHSWVDVGEGTAASVLAQVPRALLPVPPDKVGRLLATPLSGQEGFGALLAHFLTHLATGAGSYRPADGPRLGLVLLDLLTALTAHHLDDDTGISPESRRRTLYLRVRSFIHQHLGDPDLTPETVAAAHHISLRYLQRVFQSQGQTVAGYIRHQRLEHVRRDLADPALAGSPIHAIAGRWGFPHPAAFTRTFHAAFGTTPRDYRHHALTDPGAPPAQR